MHHIRWVILDLSKQIVQIPKIVQIVKVMISDRHAYPSSTHFHFSRPKTTTKNFPYIRSVPILPYLVWAAVVSGGRFPGCTGLPFKKVWPCACFFCIGLLFDNAVPVYVVAKSFDGIPKLISTICPHAVYKPISCLVRFESRKRITSQSQPKLKGSKKEPNMYQAIQTKYLGPTNYRGARIKARAAGGTITLSFDYALNGPDNHIAAAIALCEKLQWPTVLTSGCLHDGTYTHLQSK